MRASLLTTILCLPLLSCAATGTPVVSHSSLQARPPLEHRQAERVVREMLSRSHMEVDTWQVVFLDATITSEGVQGRWEVPRHTGNILTHPKGHVFECVYPFDTEEPVEVIAAGKAGAGPYRLNVKYLGRRKNYGGCHKRQWKNAEDAARFARAFLLLQDASRLPAATRLSAEEEAFAETVKRYRAATPRPVLPDAGRRQRMNAERAIRELRFGDAVLAYDAALQIAPWWPQGRFNVAIVLGELGDWDGAIHEMKRYVALVPDAADVQAANERIGRWQIALAAPREPQTKKKRISK